MRLVVREVMLVVDWVLDVVGLLVGLLLLAEVVGDDGTGSSRRWCLLV